MKTQKQATLIYIAASLCAAASAGVCGGKPIEFASLPPASQNAVIEDWKAQCEDSPAQDCASQRKRIERLLANKNLGIANIEKFAERFAKLRGLPDSEQTFLKLRGLKRDIIFAAKENDFSEIICVDAPYPQGDEAPHESRIVVENTAVFGARLLRVGVDGALKKTLAPLGGARAAIWKADLDCRAEKIVFQMREEGRTNYNLYTVSADGSNLRRLTDSAYNDTAPAWLPDGGIVFCTSRANGYIRCGSSALRSTILARCDANGKNIYFISTNNESDFTPSVLEDGRILYTRWEYIDKNIFRLQSLWSVNPDGTNPQVFWGGQSHYPDLKLGAVQIPGTDKYIFQSAGHHNVFNSGLALLVPSEGRNYPHGLYNLTPHLGWTEAGFGTKDNPTGEFVAPKSFGGFFSPFPTGKNFYLASASLLDKKHWPALKNDPWKLRKYSKIPADEKNFKLYLCDYDGNMELIFSGEYNILYAQPLRKRAQARAIPSAVEPLGDKQNAEAPAGVLYSADVYENSGIPRGAGKYLRVIEHGALTYNDGARNACRQGMAAFFAFNPEIKKGFNPYKLLGIYSPQEREAGKRLNGWLSGETAMSILLDESHKIILGEAEIESDGSVSVEIPAMRAVYFQILDKDRKVLQTMRSSTHVMSGENRGCLGCHATKFKTAPRMLPAKALRKPPQKLSKPFGGATFGFARYIQPILDKHCVSCHAQGKNKLDLSSRKIPQDGVFSAGYLNLVLGCDKSGDGKYSFPKPLAGAIMPYAVYKSLDDDTPVSESSIAPMQVLSYASPLLKHLERGHKNVKLSQKEIDYLKAWIDLNCPYYGLEDVLEAPDPDEAAFFNSSFTAYNGLSYAPKMRSAPHVDRAFRQDKFKTQADRPLMRDQAEYKSAPLPAK